MIEKIMRDIEKKTGMKSYGMHFTRKGANKAKKYHAAFDGGKYTAKQVIVNGRKRFLLFRLKE